MALKLSIRDVLSAITDLACVVDAKGTILAVNDAWRAASDAVGADPTLTCEGANYFGTWRPEDPAASPSMAFDGINEVLRGGPRFEFSYPCHTPEEYRWFRLGVSQLGPTPGHALITHVKLTDMRKARGQLTDLALSRTHMADLVSSSADAILSFDLSGRVTSWNAAAQRLYGYSAEEMIGQTLEILYPKDWPVRVTDYIDKIVAGEITSIKATRVHRSGEELDVQIFASTLTVNGAVVGISNIHRLEASDGDLLATAANRELNHRLKNLLTVIASVARQTARHAPDLKTFLEEFDGRLAGMAQSNDLLLGARGDLVSMESLVRHYLSTFAQSDSSRVRVSGPAHNVNEVAVRALGMAMHELSTNAVKYGALSVPDGRLDISWTVNHDLMRLTWAETGLSKVVAPERLGFGHRVLTQLTPRSVEGEADYAFLDTGVVWSLEMPAYPRPSGAAI